MTVKSNIINFYISNYSYHIIYLPHQRRQASWHRMLMLEKPKTLVVKSLGVSDRSPVTPRNTDFTLRVASESLVEDTA